MQPCVTNAFRLKGEFLLWSVLISFNIKYQENVKKEKFVVFTVVKIYIMVLEFMASWILVGDFSVCQRNILCQAYTLKMETVGSSETVTPV
jgi:hypothetical protein